MRMHVQIHDCTSILAVCLFVCFFEKKKKKKVAKPIKSFPAGRGSVLID